MSINEVIDVLETEMRCVRRASKGACDRDCGHCDLVLPDGQILDAYAIAIIKLKKLKERE